MTSQPRFTYASIVPLIGGKLFGIIDSLNGQLPEYLLSYSPFANNESHLIHYLREKLNWEGQYARLDIPEEAETFKPSYVDIVSAVPPCAGLSSFSTTSSADSAVNDWMYLSTQYVLENIQPKILWGENAPRLATDAGSAVANKLYEIGQKYGYSLNLYATKSLLHGNPQKRPRTYYFFTKSNHAWILPWIEKKKKDISEFFDRPIKRKFDPMDISINPKRPSENPWLQYTLAMYGANSIKELYEKHLHKSSYLIVDAKGLTETNNYNEVADWMEKNLDQSIDINARVPKRARAMQEKLDQNLGFWGHGITIPKGDIPAFIGAMPTSMINPFKEDSFVSLRDGLRIMGMPDDFDLLGKQPRSSANHICQNVGANVSKDMMDNIVIPFLNDELEPTTQTYFKQSNISKSFDIPKIIESNSCGTLEENFFS